MAFGLGGFLGEATDVGVSIVTAPVQAAANIVQGGNVVSSVASAVGGATASAANFANNATGGALGRLPVVGQDIQNASNFAQNPNAQNSIEYLKSLGKYGSAAIGGAGYGVAGGVGGFGLSRNLLDGNIEGALSSLGGISGLELPDFGSYLNNARSLIGGGSRSSVAPVNNVNSAAQLVPIESGAGNLILILGIGALGYYLWKGIKK